MKITSPAEMGLPDKFDRWRPSQLQALEKIEKSDKRITALCMPTGSGKSMLAVAAAIKSGQPTCIVTNSKSLQQQYMQDFESCGMVDLRGRSNYICDMRDGMTCEDGYAARCPYKGTVACASTQAEMRAATSSLVVTNYAKWCASKKFGQGLSHVKQLILDEGHFSYEALSSAMQVVLNYKEIEDTLKFPFPSQSHRDDMINWKQWAISAKSSAEAEMIAAQARITGISQPKPSWVRHFTHMRNLTRRLATLATARAANWIVDEVPQGYQFDPVRPGMYVESALLMRVPRVIITSATLRPKTMFMLGIGKDQFDFTEFDSEFDPKRCPIYYVPTMRVDNRNPDLRLLWMLMDRIMARRRDRNGLVQTVSYARRDEVLANSRFSESMIFNSKGEATHEIIEMFKQSPMGTTLVSPSISTGYDFARKAAEWQLLCKIPFPDGRSKIVKARSEADKEYGPMMAAQSLSQAAGRIMRDKKDQGETFIGDEHLSWFLPRYGHLFSKSFHRFYRQVDVLPQPPVALSE